MSCNDVSLDDKYLREDGKVLISGVQAIVRLTLDQIRNDRRSGLETAGFVSGYRGSPLGGLDQQFGRADALLKDHRVHVQPGINEDLAATAVWGSQQATLHPGARVDGVFGLWYGKSPGLDRSGDVLKHANMTGTSAKGGVLAVAGDDPLAKSSTLPCQSEFAFIDAEMPVLTPADIQDVLDLGLHGLALSRHSGLWVGMIALADVMDGSATVNVDLDRLNIEIPREPGGLPLTAAGGRHISLAGLQLPNRLDAERHLREVKLPAARDYARANKLNKVVWDSGRARLGLAASGKSWQVLMAALDLLGIDQAGADRLGLRLMKITMPWPLEPDSLQAFARGLKTILVVEPQRPLIEAQIKDQLYHLDGRHRPAVFGKQDQYGTPLFSESGDLGPMDIAAVLLRLLENDEQARALRSTFRRLEKQADQGRSLATSSLRTPHFCSGCPHSISTKVPDGSRAMAGIGCHIMAQWMGGEARGRGLQDSYSQMGGEGVAWIGQAPFTETRHVFANLGDGTYHHSGLLAIRAAVAAKARITYKILFNDAVAMTGGQAVDGPLSVGRIAAQLKAEGVERIVVLSEHPERLDRDGLPQGIPMFERGRLGEVQDDLRNHDGVSVLIFDQTCAAEKRRRRKRGDYPKAPLRAVINERVCEGCGDCSLQSNCPSVEPLATAFGVKRRINQSSCNQDLSCLNGFCPSFVTIEGAVSPAPTADPEAIVEAARALPLPEPSAVSIGANILLPGVGGTGVTTSAAILAMAAHIEGLNVLTTDVAGLAQKGGAVMSYLRIGPADKSIRRAKMTPGEADLLIAADLVVAAGSDCLTCCNEKRTIAVADSTLSPTAEFIIHQTESYKENHLEDRIGAAVKDLVGIDATTAAERLFGDSIFANLILVGAAFQTGALPLTLAAIEQAILLNGVEAVRNHAAFHAGRLLIAAPTELPGHDPDPDKIGGETIDQLVSRLSEELVRYQDKAYADHYKSLVARVRLAENTLGHDRLPLTEAVANNLFKLMAYKDEYEVARLHSDPAFHEQLRRQFGTEARLAVQLAPPWLSRIDPATGRPRKIAFGAWIFPLLAIVAKLKGLRGMPFDPFGWTAERRMERQLVRDYELTLERVLAWLSPECHELAVKIARIPEMIRGFGSVKAAAIEAAKAEEHAHLKTLEHLDCADAFDDETWPIAAE
ncbi:MAG: indolepyruvate ferredoxin oxidoreductase family protein [Geminicoccaceae bacterium]